MAFFEDMTERWMALERLKRLRESEPEAQTPKGKSESQDEVAASDFRVDPDLMAEELGIDAETYVDILGVYFADAEKRIKTIKESIQRGDLEEVKRATHTLKGSSLNLRIYPIAAMAKDLEESVTRRDGPSARIALSHMILTMDRLVKAFTDETLLVSR